MGDIWQMSVIFISLKKAKKAGRSMPKLRGLPDGYPVSGARMGRKYPEGREWLKRIC